GFLSVALLICNRIVGTGIFATPALIVQASGSVGSSLLLWLTGACIAAAGTAVYIEFGTGIPKNGGELNYLRFLYPKPPFAVISAYAAYATTMGWAGGNSIICGQYTLHALRIPVNQWNQRFVALLCLSIGATLHSTSVKWGLKVQNSFGMFKIAVLATIALAGLAVLGGLVKVEGDPARENFSHPFEGSRTSPNSLVTGLYRVIWSFVGYANANAALSEVKDPVKVLRRAAPLGVAAVSALYLGVNVAFFSGVSKQEMIAGPGTTVACFFHNVFGPSAETILSIFIALSAFGTVLSVLFSHGRINQEVARAGIVPFSSFFTRSSKTFGTPAAGIALHWAACVVIVVAAPPGDAYNMIINVISYPLAIINTAISGGLLLLYLNPKRAQEREWNPPFRAGLPAVAFFFAANLFLTFAPLVPPAPDSQPYKTLPYWLHVAVGVSLFVCGGVYWASWYIVLPRIGRYRLVQEEVMQADGQSRTVFRRIPT
ncbi:amino acid transporter, partial [Exidia glandulosa HHB12029]